jgi:DNA mismatch endonuclease (patch repair protein)
MAGDGCVRSRGAGSANHHQKQEIGRTSTPLPTRWNSTAMAMTRYLGPVGEGAGVRSALLSTCAPPSLTRSRNMAAVRRSDTKPEVALRRALHAAGYRYRKDFPIRIDGRLLRPDVVFTRRRIAIFVDGCFWHGCPQHGQTPAANREFWSTKLAANAARDRLQDRLLTQAGWQVIRIWEHEDPTSVVVAVDEIAGKHRS